MNKIVVRFTLFIACLAAVIFLTPTIGYWLGKKNSQDSIAQSCMEKSTFFT
jgi:hypothetical protein